MPGIKADLTSGSDLHNFHNFNPYIRVQMKGFEKAGHDTMAPFLCNPSGQAFITFIILDLQNLARNLSSDEAAVALQTAGITAVSSGKDLSPFLVANRGKN